MSIEAGTILREAREQKGVSVKEASDELHIRIPYLQALESGRAEIIPSAVQARGFLRIYAEYLNLNAADVIQEWDNPGSTALSAKKEEEPAPAPEAPVFSRQDQQPEDQVFPNRNRQQVPPNFLPLDRQEQVPTIPQESFNRGYPPVPPERTDYYTSFQQQIPQNQQPAAAAQTQPVYPSNQPIGQNGAYPPSYNTSSASVPIQAPAAGDDEKNTKQEQNEKKKSGGFHLFRKKPPVEKEKPVKEESAQELFDQIGSELAHRRTFLSLTLEDCESQTLIRSIYLESMENGNFEQLPSLIQARGMLNNYASFLDLDVEAIMLKFATALQLLSDKKNRRNEEKKRKPTKTAGRLKKFFTPDLFVGVFVIVGIAGIIIYSAITITAYRRSVSQPTPDLGISLLEQYLETTRTPGFLPTTSPTAAPTALPGNIEFEVNEPTDEPEEITSSQPVQIFVSANQRALMRVIADGKEVFSTRTLPNHTYPFDAENLIELTVSNGDAISVTYNQQNLGRLGSLGEVVSINFSPVMAATPTPQFSPTPTNTYEPTYTPQPETPLPTNTPTPYIP